MENAILVTGGAGFIGSHTCKLLRKSGFTPITYDNLSTGHETNVRWGPFVKGELRDVDHIRRVIKVWNPVCVIHFAASAYVGESTLNPSKYYNNNVKGMIALLDACNDTNVKNMVFSSSCATYGVPVQNPITEQTPQRPINPYGRTKLIGELMLEDYRNAYGLAYVALRYFNAAGADPDGDLTERHSPETHLIPRAMMAASGALERLDVFGNDYDTPDGTCVRDYIHVSDLAQAHVQAVKHLLSGGDSFAANLGSGKPTSVKEIVDTISRLANRTIQIKEEQRRAGDPPVLCADASFARTKLEFSPAFSDLETIIKTAAPSFGLEVTE